MRYEAALAYKAHPLSQRHEMGPSKPHHIEKRSFDIDKPLLDFHLAAPAVDYRMLVGVDALGASFGVIMQNLLDIYICKTIVFMHENSKCNEKRFFLSLW